MAFIEAQVIREGEEISPSHGLYSALHEETQSDI